MINKIDFKIYKIDIRTLKVVETFNSISLASMSIIGGNKNSLNTMLSTKNKIYKGFIWMRSIDFENGGFDRFLQKFQVPVKYLTEMLPEEVRSKMTRYTKPSLGYYSDERKKYVIKTLERNKRFPIESQPKPKIVKKVVPELSTNIATPKVNNFIGYNDIKFYPNKIPQYKIINPDKPDQIAITYINGCTVNTIFDTGYSSERFHSKDDIIHIVDYANMVLNTLDRIELERYFKNIIISKQMFDIIIKNQNFEEIKLIEMINNICYSINSIILKQCLRDCNISNVNRDIVINNNIRMMIDIPFIHYMNSYMNYKIEKKQLKTFGEIQNFDSETFKVLYDWISTNFVSKLISIV